MDRILMLVCQYIIVFYMLYHNFDVALNDIEVVR